MAKPNIHVRTREAPWIMGLTAGSLITNNADGQAHGISPALAAGSTAFIGAVQTINGILGGASVFSRGFFFPVVVQPTRVIGSVWDTQCLYLHLSAHLRSAGNLDLPGVIRVFTNDLWPPALPGLGPFVNAVQFPTANDLGDWVLNGGVGTQGWQEWEDVSPLTIPTPPPGFTGAGATGIRYEWRRYLGRLRSNFIRLSLTNAGSVDASEWGFAIWLSSHPGALET